MKGMTLFGKLLGLVPLLVVPFFAPPSLTAYLFGAAYFGGPYWLAWWLSMASVQSVEVRLLTGSNLVWPRHKKPATRAG